MSLTDIKDRHAVDEQSFEDGTWEGAMIRDKRHLIAEIEKLRAALKWAQPLAEIAIEAHRAERIRCGHTDITGSYRSGVRWVGIYQSEVDSIENARDALTE